MDAATSVSAAPGGASRRQAVPLAPLVAEVADVFASRAEQADVSLSVTLADPVPVALADPDRLCTALQNLLGNAVKFTPPGGHVEARAPAPMVAGRCSGSPMTVPQFPKADRGRVFEWVHGAPPRMRPAAASAWPSCGLPPKHAAGRPSWRRLRRARASTCACRWPRAPFSELQWDFHRPSR